MIGQNGLKDAGKYHVKWRRANDGDVEGNVANPTVLLSAEKSSAIGQVPAAIATAGTGKLHQSRLIQRVGDARGPSRSAK